MIHRALKVIRQFHNIKQSSLAEKLGISKSYLSEIEAGKKTINFDLLEKYSTIFDISTSSLVFFSESLEKKERLPEQFRAVFAGKILSMMEWIVELDDKETIEA